MEFEEATTQTEDQETKHSVLGTEGKNDCATFGQSLIKFMNLATGSVKMALQKPANYKKNINHRRYLQKQLKICTGRKKRTNKAKNGTQSAKKSPAEAQRFMPATEVWFRQGHPNFTRQGGENFFQENSYLPFEASFHSNGVLSSFSQGSFFAPVPSATVQDGCAISHFNNNGAGNAYPNDLLPDVMEETGSFMTGEELTRTLDIKDLFVPDRNEETAEGLNGISYSSVDKTVYTGFQTIPSAANVLSW